MIYLGQSTDNGTDPLQVAGVKSLDTIPALLHLVEELDLGAEVSEHVHHRVMLRRHDTKTGTVTRTTYNADAEHHYPFFDVVGRYGQLRARSHTRRQHLNTKLCCALGIRLDTYDQYVNNQSLRPIDLIAAWQLAEQGEGYLAELLELAIS